MSRTPPNCTIMYYTTHYYQSYLMSFNIRLKFRIIIIYYVHTVIGNINGLAHITLFPA